MVERHREPVGRIFRQQLMKFRKVCRLHAHGLGRIEIEISKINQSRIRQVVCQCNGLPRIPFPERLSLFKSCSRHRIGIRLDFQLHQLSAKCKQAVGQVFSVKGDVWRLARLRRQVHMRKWRLRILADGRRHQRNFCRERFKNQDIMHRDNRRVEFCRSQLYQRSVGSSRIHNLEQDIAEQLRVRVDRDIRLLEFGLVFNESLLRGTPRRHVEQAIFGTVRSKEQHAAFNQLLHRGHLLRRNAVRREERERHHGIKRRIIHKRSRNRILRRVIVCFLFEFRKRSWVMQHRTCKIVMQQTLLRVHKMNDSAIRIEIGNNELHQIARTHLRLGGVRQLPQSLVAIFLVKARPFVVILDKGR